MDGLVVRTDSANATERGQADEWLALTCGGQAGRTFWTASPSATGEIRAYASGEGLGAGHLYAVVQRFVGEDGLLTVHRQVEAGNHSAYRSREFSVSAAGDVRPLVYASLPATQPRSIQWKLAPALRAQARRLAGYPNQAQPRDSGRSSGSLLPRPKSFPVKSSSRGRRPPSREPSPSHRWSGLLQRGIRPRSLGHRA